MVDIFSKDELKGIEEKLFSNPLTPQNIVDVINFTRRKFLAENPPNTDTGPSALWDYTKEINGFLGTHLMRPGGYEIASKSRTSSDSLEFYLQELVEMRERGSSKPNKLQRLKSMAKVMLLGSPDVMSETITQGEKYDELKGTKYSQLFVDIGNFDWKASEMELMQASKTRKDIEPYIRNSIMEDLVRYCIRDYISANVRTIVYNPVSKAITSVQSFAT